MEETPPTAVPQEDPTTDSSDHDVDMREAEQCNDQDTRGAMSPPTRPMIVSQRARGQRQGLPREDALGPPRQRPETVADESGELAWPEDQDPREEYSNDLQWALWGLHQYLMRLKDNPGVTEIEDSDMRPVMPPTPVDSSISGGSANSENLPREHDATVAPLPGRDDGFLTERAPPTLRPSIPAPATAGPTPTSPRVRANEMQATRRGNVRGAPPTDVDEPPWALSGDGASMQEQLDGLGQTPAGKRATLESSETRVQQLQHRFTGPRRRPTPEWMWRRIAEIKREIELIQLREWVRGLSPTGTLEVRTKSHAGRIVHWRASIPQWHVETGMDRPQQVYRKARLPPLEPPGRVGSEGGAVAVVQADH